MSTSTSPVVGKLGQGLKFVGANTTYVSVANNTPLNLTTQVSISAWIKTSSNDGLVFVKGLTSSWGYYLVVDTNNKANIGLVTDGTQKNLASTASVADGKWHHIVGTYNGTTQTVYVDGVGNSQTVSGSIRTNSDISTIGVFNGGASSKFTGLIDDVRIYNRALSVGEVSQLYKYGQKVTKQTIGTFCPSIASGQNVIEFCTSTSMTAWKVPSGVTSVKVEAIGGGGGGGNHGGSGGGGGAYATLSSIGVTPGSSISVNIGAAGTAGIDGGAIATAGGDTTFNTNTVIAKGGAAGVGASITTTAGGAAAGCTPTSGAFSGGAGGAGEDGWRSGGGGGGAASRLGAGGSGGTPPFDSTGAGGGGSGGGSAGAGAGTGGSSDTGTGGGADGSGTGSSSLNHSAGGGGGSTNTTTAGTGGSGQEWDSTHGSGGGGGGGAGAAYVGSVGGAAGNYGGGGGGGGYARNGGAGAPGLIIITYKVGRTFKTAVSPVNALKSGLVGYWTFDGKDTNWGTNKTNDLSGQGNTGTLTNMSTTTSPVVGKIGQGLKFDGADDYVNVGDVAVVDNSNTQLSISAWFKMSVLPTSIATRQPIIVKYDATANEREFLLLVGHNSTSDWNKITWNVQELATSYDSTTDLKGTTALKVNQWYHVIVTYQGGNHMRIYLNGVLEAEDTTGIPTDFTNTAEPLYVGWLQDNSKAFDGLIDDVRIYNRALSAGEVAQLYKLGAAKSR